MRVKPLLDLIAEHESRGNYNAIWGDAGATFDLSKLSLNEILEKQEEMTGRKGKPSSAHGRYQIIRPTLEGLIRNLRLTGEEKFTPEMQDQLAIALLNRRGLQKWLEGGMADEVFANNLAKEWASLPVVTAIQGHHRVAQPGQSYYAGDGLNKALVSPAKVMQVLQKVKEAEPAVAEDPFAPLKDSLGELMLALAKVMAEAEKLKKGME